MVYLITLDKYNEALRRSGEDAKWSHIGPFSGPPLESVEYLDLREYNKQMVTAGSARDLQAFITAGMETIVYTGAFYERHNVLGYEALYNTIAIALLSASKGDWPSAEAFTQQHREHLAEMFKDVPM